jgi:DNA-binding winged helix-turn-helix (wHTH) protein
VARSPSITNPVRVSFDEFELDEANACLLCDGKAVALAPTPFNLLCALARQPGTLLTKDALLDAVWGRQFVTESVLKTAISDLRTALGESPSALSRRSCPVVRSTAVDDGSIRPAVKRV